MLHARDANRKDPNSCTATTFASAAACDYDPTTLRPTVGEVSICPNLFSQAEGEAKATLHHEVLHALVRRTLLQATATALQRSSNTVCHRDTCAGTTCTMHQHLPGRYACTPLRRVGSPIHLHGCLLSPPTLHAHAQGFNNDWFVFFYNRDGGRPYSVVAEPPTGGQQAPSHLTTPRLTAYARVRGGA